MDGDRAIIIIMACTAVIPPSETPAAPRPLAGKLNRAGVDVSSIADIDRVDRDASPAALPI